MFFWDLLQYSVISFTSNRNTSRSDDSIVGQCCYKNDVLETTLVGGRDTKSDPKTNFFEHFSKDLWPIMVCCEEILIANDEICMKILNEDQRYFARSFATGYSAPQVGKFFVLLMMQVLPAGLIEQ